MLPHLVAVINSGYLTQTLGMGDVAAQRALTQPSDSSVRAERTGPPRNHVWPHTGTLQVLDAYSQGLRRGR